MRQTVLASFLLRLPFRGGRRGRGSALADWYGFLADAAQGKSPICGNSPLSLRPGPAAAGQSPLAQEAGPSVVRFPEKTLFRESLLREADDGGLERHVEDAVIGDAAVRVHHRIRSTQMDLIPETHCRD